MSVILTGLSFFNVNKICPSVLVLLMSNMTKLWPEGKSLCGPHVPVQFSFSRQSCGTSERPTTVAGSLRETSAPEKMKKSKQN